MAGRGRALTQPAWMSGGGEGGDMQAGYGLGPQEPLPEPTRKEVVRKDDANGGGRSKEEEEDRHRGSSSHRYRDRSRSRDRRDRRDRKRSTSRSRDRKRSKRYDYH